MEAKGMAVAVEVGARERVESMGPTFLEVSRCLFLRQRRTWRDGIPWGGSSVPCFTWSVHRAAGCQAQVQGPAGVCRMAVCKEGH